MNPLRLLFGIFGLIGLISFVIWVPVTYRSVIKVIQWEEQPGSVVSFDQSGNPTIAFRYNGASREMQTGPSDDITEGQTVTVHFPPGRPEEAEVKSFFSMWFVTLFLGIFAVVFGGIGGIGFYSIIKRDKLKQELFVMRRGQRITVPIAEITMNYSLQVNGRHPYVIIGLWHDKTANIMREYKSDYIWYNPAQMMEGRKDIDVYVDPRDASRYWVDISFLPKKM